MIFVSAKTRPTSKTIGIFPPAVRSEHRSRGFFLSSNASRKPTSAYLWRRYETSLRTFVAHIANAHLTAVLLRRAFVAGRKKKKTRVSLTLAKWCRSGARKSRERPIAAGDGGEEEKKRTNFWGLFFSFLLAPSTPSGRRFTRVRLAFKLPRRVCYVHNLTRRRPVLRNFDWNAVKRTRVPSKYTIFNKPCVTHI